MSNGNDDIIIIGSGGCTLARHLAPTGNSILNGLHHECCLSARAG
jgi:hypothetical protein